MRINTYNLLSDIQIEEIHQGTMLVLSETGILFEDERVHKLLHGVGCRVDKANNRIRFPKQVIDCFLPQVPSQVILRSTTRDRDIILGKPGNICFFNSSGKSSLDLDTGIPRDATLKEFHDFITILHNLPNVHALVPPWGDIKGVPPILTGLESAAAMFLCSDKVKALGTMAEDSAWNLAMAKVMDQDIALFIGTQAPLYYPRETTDLILFCCENKVPFELEAGSIAGASSPVTVAGTVIASNAQLIAGLVLSQVLCSGLSVWPGNMIFTMNMHNGQPNFGSIGNSLIDMVFCQMWRHYKIPVASSTAGMSASKILDFQAGMEVSQAVLATVLSGAHCIFFQGGISQQLTAHPVKAILDDEIVGRVSTFLRGVDTSPEALSVDVIDKVGPSPGQFLTSPHTLTHWRTEQYLSQVTDQTNYDRWEKANRRQAVDYAREHMKEILSTEKNEFVSVSQKQDIQDILVEARRSFRKRGLISDSQWRTYQKIFAEVYAN